MKVKDITAIFNKMDQEKSIHFYVPGTCWDFYNIKIRENESSVNFDLIGDWSNEENPQDILDA